MKNKRVLILGASSDIGISTVNYFLKNNWYVIAHYNKNKNNLQRIKNDKLEYFKFDLKNISSFENLIKSSKILNLVDSFVSLTGYVESKNILKTDIK